MRRPSSILTGLSLAALLFLMTSSQGRAAFDVQNFRPSPGPRDLVIVPQTEAVYHLSVATGFFFNFALDPLILVNTVSDQKMADLVKNRLQFDLMAALGISKWFEVGVVFPIIFFQQSDNLRDIGREGTIRGQSIGDFSLFTKFPLVHRSKLDEGFGLALSLRTNFPTGSVRDFTSDGAFTFNPTVIMDYRFKTKKILLSTALGVYFRPTVEMIPKQPRLGPMFTAQAGVEVPLIFQKDWGISTIAGFYANVPLTTPIGREGGCVPSEALFGVRGHRPDQGLTITTGFNFGMDCGFGVPSFRYWLSMIYVPPTMEERMRVKALLSDICPKVRLRRDEKYFSGCPLALRKGNRIILLPGLQFSLDEFAVDPASFVLLDQASVEVKKALKENPNDKVLIEGHSDPRGAGGKLNADYNYNLDLSRRRAAWVLKYLVSRGIPEDRLASIGYGFTKPLPEDELPPGNISDEDFYYMTRRVDFLVVSPAELKQALEEAPRMVVPKDRAKSPLDMQIVGETNSAPPVGKAPAGKPLEKKNPS